MKEVVSLVGSSAGKSVWMQEHAADAALATGSVALPGSKEAISIRVRLGLNDEQEFINENARTEIVIGRKDNDIKLISGWPKRAIIPKRMMSSNMIEMKESGRIIVRIGGDVAAYSAVNDAKSNEIWADLVEVIDEETDDNGTEQEGEGSGSLSVSTSNDGDASQSGEFVEPTVPEKWQGLHWKQKVKLAESLVNEPVADIQTATEIIKMFAASQRDANEPTEESPVSGKKSKIADWLGI